MKRFRYMKAVSVREAIGIFAAEPGAALMAGGTNLVDLMKYDVSTPTVVVDINGLPLHDITEQPDGGLRLGALVSNADVAYDPRITERFFRVQSLPVPRDSFETWQPWEVTCCSAPAVPISTTCRCHVTNASLAADAPRRLD
jgi:hypothetical protein